MLSSKESLKILKETDALLEGHFILSSGLHSEKYIQCAKLLSKPKQAKSLCFSLLRKIFGVHFYSRHFFVKKTCPFFQGVGHSQIEIFYDPQ